MQLLHCQRFYRFRSPGLSVFLQLLQAAYPGWVDLAGIEVRLPGIAPRQLARFVDLLEAAGLPLVGYETKTRGPYRLAVEPETISIYDNGQPSPAQPSPAQPSPAQPSPAQPSPA